MTPELAYFLKVNAALVLFYAFYRLFFYKDTYFRLRRAILMTFFVISMVCPLLNIQSWIREQEPIVGIIELYSTLLPVTEVSEATATVPEWDWKSVFAGVASAIYWGVVVILLIRFVVQLISILWLSKNSRKSYIYGTKVRLLDKPNGSFSFFKLIFIHQDSFSEEETKEILVHERTHASQWHSLDVIVSELICMSCWFNPFAWLLKREVRHNLEYLADNTVIQSGYDSKSYQYHLLGLAHHNQAAATIYNSFNVLHLKNRISMMNKKRSCAIGQAKYLAFIPMAALLMLFSNIEAVARMTTNAIDAVNDGAVNISGQLLDEFDAPIVGANVLIKGTSRGTITDLDGNFTLEADKGSTISFSFLSMKAKDVAVKDFTENMKIQMEADVKSTEEVIVVAYEDQKSTNAQQKKPAGPSDKVFTVVEVMPQFPGGSTKLIEFINKSVKYPRIALENGIEGRVTCSFVVGKDGTISDAKVIRGVDPSLDAEALRVIGLMPNWIPGKQKGQVVAVKYTTPISFYLKGKAQAKPETLAKKSSVDGDIFAMVEKMPRFPGGDAEFMKFLNQTIKYPVAAQKKGIQGRVIVSFIVDEEGNLTDMEIKKGVSPELDQAALEVMKKSPKWEPGEQRGEKVKVKYVTPITFRLAKINK